VLKIENQNMSNTFGTPPESEQKEQQKNENRMSNKP